MLNIRAETPDDHQYVRTVTVEAFADSELGHHGEAELIEALRHTSGTSLSLVACRDHEAVGHILFTPVVIRTAQAESQGMGLGPLAVTPRLHRTGIGAALVTAGCARLFANACPFIVVLGRPEYYARFGFHPASQYHIHHGFTGVPQDRFSIRIGPDGTLEQRRDGVAYYCPEFGAQQCYRDHQFAHERGIFDV